MTTLTKRLKFRARELGFSLVGIARATDADGFARFREWLGRGFAGEMDYLHTQGDARQHPRSILESVRSVVMVAMEYSGRTAGVSRLVEGIGSHQPADTGRSPVGRVAAYAAGPDYHRFLWDRLNSLAAWLEAEMPSCQTEAVADTAPLLERDFARRAGLGWIAKNTMLINPHRGSFFFLGAVLTDLELIVDEPFTGSHCGTCTACLDACPTKAFPEPFVLDATKCISYLTIELRSEI
ncbi:MAG: tRNA epoxyqueuosine(34) reductase QueG, partial [Planctomycetia bacterium]|nr:tRNA epoxyqueuosine(34) reductase QueG [Planctomycetia bacterium]